VLDFEKARGILRQTEHLIIGGKDEVRPDGKWEVYTDSAFMGPSLVAAGSKILMVRFGITMLVAATFFIYFVAMDRHQWAGALLPAFGYAVLVVYFGLPSRTVASGVSVSHIAVLASQMRRIAPTKDDLARLEKGLAILRTQKLDRISRFSGIAGLGWGALFWYVTSHVFALGLDASTLGGSIGRAVVAGLAFIVVMGVSMAHTAAVRAVHTTIEFGLLEAQRVQEASQSLASLPPSERSWKGM
jgi:hypothetical protein